MKDEQKFFKKKKQKLNEGLQIIHLELVKEWNNVWYNIEKGINEKSEIEIQRIKHDLISVLLGPCN